MFGLMKVGKNHSKLIPRFWPKVCDAGSFKDQNVIAQGDRDGEFCTKVAEEGFSQLCNEPGARL